MPVSHVFSNLQAGASIEEIMDWFDVTRAQMDAVLLFAACSLDAPADRATAEILRARADAAEMDHAPGSYIEVEIPFQ